MAQKLTTEELANILYFNLPKHRADDAVGKHNLAVSKIAEDLGEVAPVIHNWLNRGSVPANRMKALMNLPGSRFTLEVLFTITGQK
jgi:hypothetical protein